MLEKIKNLDIEGLVALAKEVRKEIVEVVSKNGGHLAPSLGTVDLTIALLKVFTPPEDKILWDVGHQAYAYKILTDRKNEFSTLRTLNGISGFPKISESIYDAFGAGHAGTSISAGLGIKESMKAKDSLSKVISVIGDGAITSGLAFEAMNQAEAIGNNTITILNDNDMFISTGVGGLSSWFSRKLSGQSYNSMRNEIKGVLSKLPPFFKGDKILAVIRRAMESSMSLITPGILFEGFGYHYVGPIDGHNIEEMIETFNDILYSDSPILLHVVTKKGKGYKFAEDNPRKFHGLAPFDIETGEIKSASGPSFTSYLSNYLPSLFERNNKLVAITAAMPDGTGLSKLQDTFPERVYDVSMCEAHAVTFAAGLASGGLKPFVAIYSTFLQRAYDSIIHDVALQNLPVVFLVDRAGIVGEDGATHHGIFDIAFFRPIPNITIMAPKDELEMVKMIELAATMDSPAVIRYPRGSGVGKKVYNRVTALEYGKGELIKEEDSDTLIVGVGITSRFAIEAYPILKKSHIYPSIYDLKFVKPLPEDLFALIKKKRISKIITVEEGIVAAGAGSALLQECAKRDLMIKFRNIGVDDTFSQHGTQKEIRNLEGISAVAVADAVKSIQQV